MQLRIMTAVFVSVFAFHTAAQGQDDRPDGLKVLDHFVGAWSTTSLNKLTETKTNIKEATGWILKDRFILGREISQPDGVKSFWLMTFDPKTNSYPFWYFNNQGVYGGEWNSSWDSATKTLAGKATDTPQGWTSRGANHFPDDDTNQVTMWMKDDTGKMRLDAEAKKTRQPDGAAEPALAEWSKSDSANPPAPAETKILAQFLGTWDADLVYKPATWTPKEVRATRTSKSHWVLDGRCVHSMAQDSDGQESLFLSTFDPQTKSYRQWRFNSTGQATKTAGDWHEASRTLTLKGTLDGGLEFRIVRRFLDKNHFDWSETVKDSDGKRYFHLEGRATRRKE